MTPLTHLDDAGRARQVNVGDKAITRRQATARACISLPPALHQVLAVDGVGAKGDVLATARIAGIQAAKRTHELIPLCHQVPLDGVSIEERLGADQLEIRVTVHCTARTGVEMEALTAASVAVLCVYDMLKALSHDMVIGPVELVHKAGGRSGNVDRERGLRAGL